MRSEGIGNADLSSDHRSTVVASAAGYRSFKGECAFFNCCTDRADCPNASEEKRKEQPDRWIHVSWGTDTNDSYPTTIEAVCKDRLNLLLDVSAALSTTKTFVLGLNSRSTEDGFAIIRIEIQIKDGAQLSTLMNKLHQISGVLQVNRPVG